jgi:dihydrofolate synthase/folylpolyglutamate synthase
VRDIEHNPQAAAMLAATLGTMGFAARTTAVFGIMADKDVDGVIGALRRRVDAWNVATLPPPRGTPAAKLRERLQAAGVDAGAIREFDDPASAYRAAVEASGGADRIVAFGSFLTVAGALAA